MQIPKCGQIRTESRLFRSLSRRHLTFAAGPDQNGDATIKEFLLDHNVDLSKFETFRRNKFPRPRRLLRGVGGEITVPVPRTNQSIKDGIKT